MRHRNDVQPIAVPSRLGTAALCAVLGVLGVLTSNAGGAARSGTAGAELIAADRGASDVSAYRGTVMWSHYERGGLRNRLVEWVGGTRFLAPVAVSSSSFDLDLGASETGSPVAVFTRCGRDGLFDCDLRGLDPTQAVTYPIAGGASPRCAEGTPSIWARTVAFSRVPLKAGGSCEVGLFISRGGAVTKLGRRIPVATDLSGDLLAAAYVAAPKGGSPEAAGTSSVSDAGTRSWITLHDLRTGTSTVVAAARLGRRGRGTLIFNPVLDRGTLYYLRADGSRRQRIVGSRVAPGGADVVTGHLDAAWFTVDAGRIYFTNLRGVHRLPG